MRAKKDDNGFMTIESQNNRFINVLKLMYLESEQVDNKGYFIPKHIMEKIETELDFNTNLTSRKLIIEEQKKKYRKRQSYIFWMDILINGNFADYNSAKQTLMSIHNKTSSSHTTLTHVRYAMETLYVALDDHFETNKAKIIPNRFLQRNCPLKNKKKGVKKCTKQSQKKKLTRKKATIKKSTSYACPF